MLRAIAGTTAWSWRGDLETRCRVLARSLGLSDRNIFIDATGHAAFCGQTFPSSAPAVFTETDSRFDPTLTVVGDLRIDNRGEFIARCGVSAGSTDGFSDIDLIALGWSRCEERIFDALVGPYAVAIWCGRRHRLVLARDPQGIRPLFFHCSDDSVTFASLPNALAALPEIKRQLNRKRLLELLMLVDPQGNPSFFDGIEAVRKGEIVCFDAPSQISRRQFWDARNIPVDRRRSPDQYAEGLRECMIAAVGSAVDTPLTIASALSGGFDSGAVTSLAADKLRGQGRELLAYTAIPDVGDPPSTHPRWLDDESELAAAVVRQHANIRHRCISPQVSSLGPLFDFFFDHVGTPCLTPVVSLWYSEIERQAVADGAGVLLMATGGNFTISYHGAPFLMQLAEQRRWLRLLGWLLRLRGGHPSFQRGPLIRKILRKQFGEAGWERLRRLAGKRPLPSWTETPPSWSAVAAQRLTEFLADADQHVPRFEILHGGLGSSSDRTVWLMRETLLPLYEKAVWMQRGIEVRDPTLDRRVVEYCLSIPEEEFLRGGQARAVFRRAFGRDLPPAILANDRIGRQGYGRHRSLRLSLPAFRDEIDRVPANSPARQLFDLAALDRLTENLPDSDDGTVAFDHANTTKLSRGMSALHFTNRMAAGN